MNIIFKKYRKKPVDVRAFQLTREILNRNCGLSRLINGFWIDFYEDYAIIETLKGELKANIGDYIVIGIKGEPYPVNKDIFHDLYDEIEWGE